MQPSEHDNQEPGWADRPRVRQRIRYVLYAVCALLVAADFVIHRHIEVPMEDIPFFYAFYGFLALVTVVMAAKGLRCLVGREEDYYRKGDDDAA